MKKARILSLVAVFGGLILSSCTVDKTAKVSVPDNPGLVFSGEPEPVSGRLDVYTSMARAVKYNVDTASQNLRKRIYSQNPNERPRDVVDNILNNNINSENALFGASRVLEYAIIYAMTVLNDKPDFVDNYYYLKSSQHLAEAAISSHQDTWFAAKKIKEIDRLIKQEQKILTGLNQKFERQGSLSKEDLHYKKNLEVALLKLDELRKSLAFSFAEYGLLAKVEPNKINLEGRRFYELEDFDDNFKIEIFQEAAIRNRSEFAIAKEQVRSYDYDGVRAAVIRQYPLIERLDINGVKIEDNLYNKELQQKAEKVAENLLEAAMDYRRATNDGKVRDARRRRAYDELAAAILTQVEVNFKLVELATADYQNTELKINQVRKEISQLQKNSRLSIDQRIMVLNDKIALMELERKKAQIAAERAMSLRSLYFNAGFSPFSKPVLKGNIKDITLVLKSGFNQDMVEMLAAASTEVKRDSNGEGKGWAGGSDWLERVVDNAPKIRSAKVVSKPSAAVSGVYGTDAATKKVMQLGAYVYKQNALDDWEKLKLQFAELKKFTPQLERTHAGESGLYRLIISAPGGNLQNLCNEMKRQGAGCLLR